MEVSEGEEVSATALVDLATSHVQFTASGEKSFSYGWKAGWRKGTRVSNRSFVESVAQIRQIKAGHHGA